jgi:hypothetical protein
VFPNWLGFLKRSPRAGERKDPIMSEPTESPGGSTAPAGQAPDVARQIAQLTDAVNRLVQAQQAPQPTVQDHLNDIGGEIPGGHAPRAAIDAAKLTPLQQITLGLRDAKPVGPVRAGVVHAPDNRVEESEPQGAD